MTIDASPLKVSVRSEPATIAEPPPARAICAAPSVTAAVPSSFDRRMRTRSPPRLTRAISRTVWLLGAATGSLGGAPQLATQSSSPAIAEDPDIPSSSSAASESTKNRRRRNGAADNAVDLIISSPGVEYSWKNQLSSLRRPRAGHKRHRRRRAALRRVAAVSKTVGPTRRRVRLVLDVAAIGAEPLALHVVLHRHGIAAVAHRHVPVGDDGFRAARLEAVGAGGVARRATLEASLAHRGRAGGHGL